MNLRVWKFRNEEEEEGDEIVYPFSHPRPDKFLECCLHVLSTCPQLSIRFDWTKALIWEISSRLLLCKQVFHCRASWKPCNLERSLQVVIRLVKVNRAYLLYKVFSRSTLALTFPTTFWSRKLYRRSKRLWGRFSWQKEVGGHALECCIDCKESIPNFRFLLGFQILFD